MQTTQKQTGLVWFRNDLRVIDNLVLETAVSNHDHIIAVFCFDPRHYELSSFGFKKTEKYRAQFLIETVSNLKQNLQQLHIELFIFYDFPEIIIPKLAEQYDISDIYSQKEWTSEEKNVSTALREQIVEAITHHEIYNQFLYHPDDISMEFKAIPKVFTAYRKTIESESRIRPINNQTLLQNHIKISNETKVPSLSDLGLETFKRHPHTAFPFKGGEDAAMDRLHKYFFETKKLGVYKKTRNGLIGKDFSSKFSPWLANGSISARSIYWQVKAFEKEFFKNESTYWLIFELIWRDYFKYISLKHGNDIFKTRGILKTFDEWNHDEQLVQKWIHGKTHSAFVNANMIELQKTGWMSNRGRQNVASFFAKNMLMDWRIGAAYFESLLLDYDVHSNYGNWMYVAGVGNDPRDRKFNVDLQAKRYDPNGTYQKLWLQEVLF